MNNKQTWSIIIFCFNEAKTVGTVFNSVVDTFSKNGVNVFEIIIVNDGSSDGSDAVINKIVAENSSFAKAVHHPVNLGIGHALRSGYTNAQFENVCAIPADGQFDFSELIPFLNFSERTFISFFRKENLTYTLFRNILSIVNKKINAYFIGIHLHDVNWVKAYKTNEIKSFEWKISSSLIESELCAKLILRGNKVIEVSSVYHPRVAGVSKGASIKIVIQALKETIKLIGVIKDYKSLLKS